MQKRNEKKANSERRYYEDKAYILGDWWCCQLSSFAPKKKYLCTHLAYCFFFNIFFLVINTLAKDI